MEFRDEYKVNNDSYSAMIIGSGSADQSTPGLFWHAELSQGAVWCIWPKRR